MALSCDDTKLHAAWRTYYDPEKKQHFLVGGTGSPIAIANVDELREILRNSGEKDKATKVSFHVASTADTRDLTIRIVASSLVLAADIAQNSPHHHCCKSDSKQPLCRGTVRTPSHHPRRSDCSRNQGCIVLC